MDVPIHTFGFLTARMFEGEGGAGTTTTTQPPPKVFTQEEVNSIVAKEKKGFTEKLEQMGQNFKMTEEQRKQLEAQVEDIKTSSLTEKERLAQELEKTKKKLATTAEESEKNTSVWKNRFESSTIKTALSTASQLHEAFNPTQIEAILAPSSRSAEILGDDGKPTGKFVVKTKITTKGADGKTVELEVEPNEAVKILKEQPEYANLFKGTQVPGIGGNNGATRRPGPLDLKDMSHTDYLKNRQKILESTRNK